MGTRDEKKTKQQLIDELEALRAKVAEQGGREDADATKSSSEPSLTRPISRRTALTNWVVPVILSIPLGAAGRVGRAEAGSPTMMPTPAPTGLTPAPTFPTIAPTGATPAPTGATPAPTGATPAPTAATPAPTAFPTSVPTTAAAVPVLGLGGAAVLGGALAAAKLLKGMKSSSNDADDDEGGEDE